MRRDPSPLDMAARSTIPSSRRSRESAQGEMAIGSFRRLEEIGRGSFATVYKAAYSVSTLRSMPAEMGPELFHVFHSLLNFVIGWGTVLLCFHEECPNRDRPRADIQASR